MPKNRKNVWIDQDSSLQTAIISRFKLPEKDTIPIQSAAKMPRLGTIGKNHIQSSLSFVKANVFAAALNLILLLKIVPSRWRDG